MTNDEFKVLCLSKMAEDGQWATAYAMALVVDQLIEAHQAAFEMISLLEKCAKSLDRSSHIGDC